jgi:hypothetical protein
VIQALNAEVNALLAGPGRQALADLGLDLGGGMAGGTPEQAAAFIAAEIARHAALVRAAGIVVE